MTSSGSPWRPKYFLSSWRRSMQGSSRMGGKICAAWTQKNGEATRLAYIATPALPRLAGPCTPYQIRDGLNQLQRPHRLCEMLVKTAGHRLGAIFHGSIAGQRDGGRARSGRSIALPHRPHKAVAVLPGHG